MRFLLAAAVLLVAPSALADEPHAEGPIETPIPEAPPAPPPPPKQQSGVTGRVQGGYGTRRLFGESATGGAGAFGVGGYRGPLDFYIDFRLFLGSDEGLPFKQFSLGPSIAYELAPRFRLGGGISFGGTIIGRRTGGGSLTSIAFGARIFASYDIWQFDDDKPHSAIFVLGQLEAETEGSFAKNETRSGVPTTGTWGPSIMLGARF